MNTDKAQKAGANPADLRDNQVSFAVFRVIRA
jgi:hypothetical protein